MKTFSLVPASLMALFATGALGQQNATMTTTPAVVFTTITTTAYTTYCPGPTTLTQNGQTFTVTTATTLTITNCPGGCTITVPVTTATGLKTVYYNADCSSSSAPSPPAKSIPAAPASYSPVLTAVPANANAASQAPAKNVPAAAATAGAKNGTSPGYISANAAGAVHVGGAGVAMVAGFGALAALVL